MQGFLAMARPVLKDELKDELRGFRPDFIEHPLGPCGAGSQRTDLLTSVHKTVHLESEISGLPGRCNTGQVWALVWCDAGLESSLAEQSH